MSEEDVEYHVILLCDAGFLAQTSVRTRVRTRLTWEGHEFIEAARNEGLWQKALAATQRNTGGIAVELVKDYLLHMGRRLLNLE